ncbi:MAG: hypothetical protein OHK0018_14870 [Erythrobacter tepidarius]
MPIAAVPHYLGSDFKTASPGMRFGMYLKLWGVNRRSRALLWTTYDLDYEVRGEEKKEREVKRENKTAAIDDACRLDQTEKALVENLAARQRAAFDARAGQGAGLAICATAIAPFTTGLGNEHPLENGFAFLWPYGLPYLPGSGVKGVLRRAAEELADGMWGDKKGWSKDAVYPLMRRKSNGELEEVEDDRGQPIRLSVLDVLFGREPPQGDSNAVRGALAFWGVIPEIAGNHLMVEIMTPHQSHYYQQKRDAKSGNSVSPHDSGQPNPIAFLTVPPGSKFCFHVVCDEAHLRGLTQKKQNGAPDLLAEGATHWKALLTAAFEHAFEWLGFGAKTAVGYGAMKRDADAEARAEKERRQREAQEQREREAAERERRRAAMSANMRRIDDFRREFDERAEQLRGNKEKPHGDYHGKARSLAKDALEGADWTPEERRAAAEAIEEWLPKVVKVDMKDERKKLKLAALKGQA